MGQPRNLEEIVVTATPINQSLGNVAAAVSVIEKDDIQLARQQLALDESLSRVPGVFMQNRYNFAQDLRIAIRGFGARAAFGIRGIKILVDGIPETLPDGQGSVDSIDLGATGRIEVLRGPSSSMYGNASGGVIAVTTEDPPENHETQLRVSAGEYGFRKLQAKIAGTAGSVGYVVSASDSDLDGYRQRSKAENTQLSARLRFDLRNDQELTTVFNYTDQPTSDDPGGINLAQATADPRSARDANIDFAGGEALEQTKIGAVYTIPFGNGHALNARGYYVTRDFTNSLPFLSGGQVQLDREFIGGGVSYMHSGMLGGRPNELIIGFDFNSQDDDRLRFDNLNGTRGALTFDQNEKVESRGIYIQDVYALSNNVDLSFGVRFDDVEYDISDRFLADGFNDSGSLDFSNTSPMIGISVELTDALNVYANFSTAFETPTTTELATPDDSGGFNAALTSQDAENLEVGLRGALGRHSVFDAALFQIDVDDELLPNGENSAGRDIFINAGSSSRTGLEFSLVSEPTDRLRTTLSYTWSDFEFDDFGAFSGNDIPGIADTMLFAEVTYSHPDGWFASLDASWVGEQYANNANTTLVDNYTVANLRIGAQFERRGTRLAPFIGINNLTDETYFSNIRINSFGGRFYEPAPDRNIYAGITIDFGG
jgi:iron complex outermembrane receptor protein